MAPNMCCGRSISPCGSLFAAPMAAFKFAGWKSERARNLSMVAGDVGKNPTRPGRRTVNRLTRKLMVLPNIVNLKCNLHHAHRVNGFLHGAVCLDLQRQRTRTGSVASRRRVRMVRWAISNGIVDCSDPSERLQREAHAPSSTGCSGPYALSI
jgi:hypothetical protein